MQERRNYNYLVVQSPQITKEALFIKDDRHRSRLSGVVSYNVVTFLKVFSKKDYFDVLTNVFILLDDRKYNGMIKSIIDHNPAGEKQIWLLQREHYYLHQKCGAAGAVGYNALLSPVTEFQNTLANLGLFIRRSCKKSNFGDTCPPGSF